MDKHRYHPSTMHMGDCSICGNLEDSPLHIDPRRRTTSAGEAVPAGGWIEIAQKGFEAWAAKPHNAKWARKIDGTPIPNDLTVCIGEAFAAALDQATRRAEEAKGAYSIALADVTTKLIAAEAYSATLRQALEDFARRIDVDGTASQIVSAEEIRELIDRAALGQGGASNQATSSTESRDA